MPRPVPLALRQLIVTRHLAGETLPHLARTLHLSRWTVRAFWRHYRADPLQGLALHYACAGPPLAPRLSLLHRAALTLRRRHPTWGAGLNPLSARHQMAATRPAPRRAHTCKAGFAKQRSRRPGAACRPSCAPGRRSRMPSGKWMPWSKSAAPMAGGSAG
jgi:hypothetical protein